MIHIAYIYICVCVFMQIYLSPDHMIISRHGNRLHITRPLCVSIYIYIYVCVCVCVKLTCYRWILKTGASTKKIGCFQLLITSTNGRVAVYLRRFDARVL